MKHSSELQLHNIFYDNSVYRPLAKKGNEGLYVSFYDSLMNHVPSLDNSEYQVYFTWSSLLEAIGDGNFLEKYEPRLNLDDFCISENISEESEEALHKTLSEHLSAAYSFARTHFLNHPELSQKRLLEKIDDQLKYSTNPAVKDLIDDTLGRYRALIIEDFDWARESCAQHLTWDAICAFPFANLDQRPKESQESTRRHVRQISEWLLRRFHDGRAEGFDFTSFRLVDKIQKELLTNRSFIERIEKEQGKSNLQIYIPGLLDSHLKDLCDADYIHFSTFGLNGSPGIMFTADDKDVVYTRLVLQLAIMRFLCAAEKSKLQLFPGIVFIVNPLSGLIIDKIDVSEIKENDHIKIIIDELENGGESFVTFKKPESKKESAELARVVK